MKKTSKGFIINDQDSLPRVKRKEDLFSQITEKIKPKSDLFNLIVKEKKLGVGFIRQEDLKTAAAEQPLQWVKKNIAILIIHGIGEQLPLQTIDMFGRGLIGEYKKAFPQEMKIDHQIFPKPSDRSDIWFDNAVRIKKEGSDFFIDIYEYYWANYAEDKAAGGDITDWIEQVVQAKSDFHSLQKQEEVGKAFNLKGFFYDKKGRLNVRRYRLVLKVIRYLPLLCEGLLKLLRWILSSFVPYFGSILKAWFTEKIKKIERNFDNLIGDIVVYTVTDPKSKYYDTKRQILDGAVNAIKYLIEKEKYGKLFYDSVIIAGHSLGSQVGYDAINKINLLIGQKKITSYSNSNSPSKRPVDEIKDQLNGFITFGSPLDKIAFFLREIVPDEEYLRQQLLDSYHCFKQRDWSQNRKNGNTFTPLGNKPTRFLDTIQWRNYYNKYDYVSDPLHFYENLTNVECFFVDEGIIKFTHSYYWNCSEFYMDIINNFL